VGQATEKSQTVLGTMSLHIWCASQLDNTLLTWCLATGWQNHTKNIQGGSR